MELARAEGLEVFLRQQQDVALASALVYAGAGLPVFPCRPRGKEPLTEHGYLDASFVPRRDRRMVAAAGPPRTSAWRSRRLRRRRPRRGRRARAAPRRRLPPAGDADLPHVAGVAPLLPPAGRPSSRCCAGPVAGVDLKGFRGYALVPPSVHPSGAVYAWSGIGFDIDLVADAPDWLVGCPELAVGRTQPPPSPSGENSSPASQRGSGTQRWPGWPATC